MTAPPCTYCGRFGHTVSSLAGIPAYVGGTILVGRLVFRIFCVALTDQDIICGLRGPRCYGLFLDGRGALSTFSFSPDVSHVPSLKMNLFSASQLFDSGCRVILDADSCAVQDRRTHALVGAGPRSLESPELWELNWLRVPPATLHLSVLLVLLHPWIFSAVSSSAGSPLWLLFIVISS
ncbi:hypothetical protein QYE76_070408 [Lolium multiflorum]|uniref:Uncharacterized protein n=1 Tax=Lolium multiflorum TaxID=4521 RepID=A0AAD8SJQ9_LOLMU|nr:hypothetical protein QYE76_070408 [Lolium multiflorum]